MPTDPSPHGAPDSAPAELTETVYGHLRAIAGHKMSTERAGHSLSATAA